jgi:hypothetical protein
MGLRFTLCRNGLRASAVVPSLSHNLKDPSRHPTMSSLFLCSPPINPRRLIASASIRI